MTPNEALISALAPFGIVPSEQQLEKINTYSNFMIEYNEKVNLTAITDPVEVAVKHFADSLAPLSLTEIKPNASLIDVGTGAGFPGVPMKLFREDLDLTLLDSLNKRLVFLQQLSEKLGQQNRFIHARAEQAGIDTAVRAKYDIATARAVSSVAVLCEYCLPLLKIGGKMLALKGPDCAEEVKSAAKAIKILGGKLLELKEYELADAGSRTLVVIEKVSHTPIKYPRQRVKLSEKPL